MTTAANRLSRLREEGGFFALDAVARFAVRGQDRLRYLNGQLTNDLRKLSPGRAMQACVLSAKGKLDGVVWIWSEPEQLIIEAEAVLAEPLLARLDRYIVADDVELAPIEPEATIHVFGSAAKALTGRQISRLGVPGVDLPAGANFGDLIEAAPDEIERLRIERCLPRWGAELGPETLPAEAGLDASAVDFHKGCYIGQEVVSRIRSVGHANRVLRVFEVVEGTLPVVGQEFFSANELTRPAAIVTSVHFALSSAVGLCYIRRGTVEGATLASRDGSSQIQIRQPACVSPS